MPSLLDLPILSLIEHLVKHNGVFYVSMAIIYDESRGRFKNAWRSKCAKKNDVPVFSGSDIGVTPPQTG